MDPTEANDSSSRPTTAPPAPRWVMVLAIAGIAILAVAILVMILSSGEHGPGRHL